jgi:hypothetical protein
MKSNDIYFLSDKTVDFRYWHHFTQNNNNFTSIDKFLKIMNNRYIKFKNILYSEKKKLFITGQHFDYIYKKIDRFDKLIELYNILKNINKNIILLAFNYSNKEFKKDDLHHYIINVSYNIDFKTSKDLFINNFNEHIKTILISYF